MINPSLPYLFRNIVGQDLRITSTMLLHDASYYTVATCMLIISVFSLVFCALAIHMLLQRSHRTTNQFIKPDQILLIGLCVSDVLLAISGMLNASIMFLPFQAPEKLIFSTDYLFRFTMLSSLLHILALTFERGLSVRFPFLHRSCKTTKALLFAASIWIVSLALSALPFKDLLGILSLIIAICDLILIIAYIYILTKMFQSIRNQATLRRLTTDEEIVKRKLFQKESRATFVCFLMVISFIILTTPLLVWTIRHKNKYAGQFHVKEALEDYIIITAFLSKALCDPLLYIFRGVLSKRCQWRKTFGRSRSESTASAVTDV